jgi:hypothetical protein
MYMKAKRLRNSSNDSQLRRWKGVGETPRPGRFTHWEDPIAVIHKARWSSGQILTGLENIANTGIRTQDRPTLNESLYQLLFPGRLYILVKVKVKQFHYRP